MAGPDHNRGPPPARRLHARAPGPGPTRPSRGAAGAPFGLDGGPTLAGGRSTASATPIEEEQARTELVRALSGTPFPADRRRLLAAAQRGGVAEPLRQRLGELPADERFADVQAVWRAIAASAPRDR